MAMQYLSRMHASEKCARGIKEVVWTIGHVPTLIKLHDLCRLVMSFKDGRLPRVFSGRFTCNKITNRKLYSFISHEIIFMAFPKYQLIDILITCLAIKLILCRLTLLCFVELLKV